MQKSIFDKFEEKAAKADCPAFLELEDINIYVSDDFLFGIKKTKKKLKIVIDK
uniref:hypothetical protein n=1 Tax=Agathobacter sp. TaxID=2021311 RepID=UPI0040564878